MLGCSRTYSDSAGGLDVPPAPRPGYDTLTNDFLKKSETFMDSTISLQTTVVAVSDQVSCRLDDETVVLELRKGTYYGLNSVGTLIWDLIQQPQSIEAVYSAVLEQYGVDSNACKQDVLRLIEELQVAGLVELKSAA